MANHHSAQFNRLQSCIGYLCYANHVLKRVLAILNHLGIAVSHGGIIRALKSNAESVLNKLRQVCAHEEAIQLSFDNMTFAVNVRD